MQSSRMQLNGSFVKCLQSARTTSADKSLAKRSTPGAACQRFKNDYTKAVPSPALWAAPRLHADHVSDGATPSLLQPLVCCKGIIPANPLFSREHQTHTYAHARWRNSKWGKWAKAERRMHTAVSSHQHQVITVGEFSRNPRQVMKTRRQTADGGWRIRL